MSSKTSEEEDIVKPSTAIRPGKWNPLMEPDIDYGELPHNRKLTCIRRISISFFMSITLYAIYIIFFHDLFLPDVLKFYVQSFSLSSLNISDSQSRPTWDINFLVQNPNLFVRTECNSSNVYVLYDNKTVASSQDILPWGIQKSNMSVLATIKTDEKIGNGTYMMEMQQERRSGKLIFDIRVSLTVRYCTFWVPSPTRTHFLWINCTGLTVTIPKNSGEGRLIGGLHECFGYYDSEKM